VVVGHLRRGSHAVLVQGGDPLEPRGASPQGDPLGTPAGDSCRGRAARGWMLVSGALVIRFRAGARAGKYARGELHAARLGWNASPGSARGRARCWVLRERPLAAALGPDRYPLAGCRCRPYLENCTVDASIICSCQVDKGTRWMPWHQEPKKDVGACDKPRGVGNQTSIRGCPNRET
jgi:hypothetical protein